MANYMVLAGAIIFFVLGLLHLILSFLDVKDPKRFIPAKTELLAALKTTTINMRKDARNFWLSSLGFHFSHSIGVMFYGFIVGYCALVRPDFFADYIIRIVIVLMGASYVAIARAFWFIIPVIGSLIGVAFIGIGLAVLYPY
ncbi:LIC_13387 family protein [Hyphococcus sp. DH-69]|uniref:LIC_13387 family protein n=1 Tax=Hyphococcus formosus TaxID=3143534 RepID=UPI00398A5379